MPIAIPRYTGKSWPPGRFSPSFWQTGHRAHRCGRGPIRAARPADTVGRVTAVGFPVVNVIVEVIYAYPDRGSPFSAAYQKGLMTDVAYRRHPVAAGGQGGIAR